MAQSEFELLFFNTKDRMKESKKEKGLKSQNKYIHKFSDIRRIYKKKKHKSDQTKFESICIILDSLLLLLLLFEINND